MHFFSSVERRFVIPCSPKRVFVLIMQYGDCFTFVLLGKKTTVFLGAKGNQFILNASTKHLNAEEVYGPLTTPVFGKGVVYDCPNAKLMDQKRVCSSNHLVYHAC
jgi:cytochrome P450